MTMRLLLLSLVLPLLVACSSLTSHRDPAVRLSQFKRFYVEQRLNDNHATGDLIAAALRARGYLADCGPLTMMPKETEVLINYDARWTWDFHSYLIDLDITVRRAFSDKILAAGSYHHPGVTPKKPAVMINALLDKFFRH
jgi:hypothetical protein